MTIIYWDCETFSDLSLKEYGAYVYAGHKSTGIHFFCYAVDDSDDVEVWKPGDAVPEPFANPLSYFFVSDNWEFERAIHARILVELYGFFPIPLENQDCAQRLALANAYPAELGLRCEALGLPYRKDPEARKAMLRLSRPQAAKKRKKPVDPAAHERDLVLLRKRCMDDVRATRAAYTSPRLRPLLPEERQLLLLDAKINARGVCANVPFLEAAQKFAVQERNAINTRLNELTAGVITSVNQVARIMEAVNARGHDMTSLNKRAVAATLAHQPAGFVKELLELRQRGAFASTTKFKKLLNFSDPKDHRIRSALRIYSAGPGRWSAIGAQLHNLPRNDAELPSSLVAALIAGDRTELARYGNPLKVISGISRAALCAASGNTLIAADLSTIESRILAWLAGETWKLEMYRRFDATKDKELDHYRVLAHRMLRKDGPVSDITAAERQLGKCAELACGFGGSIGAWRRIAHDTDERSDEEVHAIIRQWRDAHPAIRALWRELAQAARVTIQTGMPILVAPAPRPPIIAAFDGHALSITGPSGRAINYPGAHLTPNTKFEGTDPDIEFFDNARGQWKPARAWFGTLVENVVQGTARDLLAAAIIRAEARGWSVVFHCHDELVIEASEGTISEAEVLALLLEAPAWAAGLPLGGKVHSGRLYLEAPGTAEPPAVEGEQELVERAVDALVASTRPMQRLAAPPTRTSSPAWARRSPRLPTS
jgi:DNA polymerase